MVEPKRKRVHTATAFNGPAMADGAASMQGPV
ncbi:hypothetical protein FOXG_22960, partial [Fusarium oxysporum f. sp. lycopersici 4287]